MRIPRQASARIGLALWLVLAAAGCRSPGPRAPAGPPLRIGVVEDAPPLVFRQDRRWSGLEAELGRALATRLGQRAVFVAFPPVQLETALLDGKVDVLMAGFAITEDRRVRMDFANPYLVVGQSVLVRSQELMRVNTPIKIYSIRARVGVVAGSAGDRLVSRYFTQAIRHPFPHADEALEALRRSQIDMVVHDAPALWWIARNEPALAVAPPLFAKEEIGWAFRRSSVSLRESANQALVDWRKDGTLEAILRRWIPVSQ